MMPLQQRGHTERRHGFGDDWRFLEAELPRVLLQQVGIE